jgi:hypothetical protein
LYDALAADKFNFSTRVVLVGADAQVTDDMGCYVWPAIRIKQAGSGEKFPLTMTRTEKNTSLGKVFCPGGKFEIDLYRNSKELGDDVPDVKVEIPDNWSVFNFLVDGPERFLDFNPEFWFSWDAARFDKENSIWESRLTLSSLDGRKLYFDIMFKLPEGVACIRNWRSILEEIRNDNRSEKVI